MDGRVTVPGTPACLGCRRALAERPDLPDLWLRRPPGGSLIACDERGVCFRGPLPAGAHRVVTAVFSLLLLGSVAGSAPALIGCLLVVGLWVLVGRRPEVVRHYWGMAGGRVFHVVGIGRWSVLRSYSGDTVRAFHCSGPRGCGAVAFHHGPYTVRVTSLSAPADNQWLMVRLNERLARARRAVGEA